MSQPDDGVASLLEYVMITGILLVLLVVVLATVNTMFMEGPADTLKYHAYTDIGNGVSVRIVDLYVIAPPMGGVTTWFDLPDDVAGQWYSARITAKGTAQAIAVGQESQKDALINLAGIAATMGVRGYTTGSSITNITYNSRGV